MTTSLLDRLPADVAAVLSLAPGLQGLPVLGPSREPGAAAVTDQVMASLGKGTLVGAAGAAGLCVWIGEIEADSAESNLPQVILEARLRVTILENMLLNKTGVSVLEAAVFAAGALHHWSPGENVILIPDKPFFAPTSIGDAETMQPDPDVRGYELTWRLPSFGLQTDPRTRAPSAVYDDDLGLLTLSCPDSSAAIWWTSDDQGGVPALPAPGEPSAAVYAVPLAVAAGTTVRVATHVAGEQLSQCLMITI
jgi:hypothetical protein